MLNNNPDFYPTPKNLSLKMVSKIDNHFNDNILEPSAGKGDLIDAIQSKFNTSYGYKKSVDCIEYDDNLQLILSSKDRCNLIDSDFLTYTPSKQYDTIIMNPPFSNGVKHVLKAWEIIYHGDVIALLNAETIKNPHSKERQLLCEIIKEFGDIEYIQDAFKSAERKTGVEVALIHLRKRNDIQKDYFDGLTMAKNESEPEFQGSDIAIPTSQIENSVKAYNKAIEIKKQAIIKDQEAEYFASMIKKQDSYKSGKEHTVEVKKSFNEYVEKLRESAWMSVMYMADFKRHMTERVQKEIDTQIEVVKKLEFTESNIQKFLSRLISNQSEIANQCVLDVFDMFTKYHKENRVHIEGWKSNDIFFVGRRVVLPGCRDYYAYGGKLKVKWDFKRKLEDIDRVVKLIMGKAEKTLVQAVEEHDDLTGVKAESSYFSARFYKKGTMHLYFENKHLLDNLNLIVGRQRGWLPQAKEQVPKEFWLMNE